MYGGEVDVCHRDIGLCNDWEDRAGSAIWIVLRLVVYDYSWCWRRR